MVQKDYRITSVNNRNNARESFRVSLLRLGGEEVRDNLYGNDVYHCSELRTTVVYYPQDFEVAIVGEEENYITGTASRLEKIGKIRLEEL